MSGYVVECDLCAKAPGRFIAVLKANNSKLESVVIPVLVDLWRARFDVHNAKMHGGKATLLITRDGTAWNPAWEVS